MTSAIPQNQPEINREAQLSALKVALREYILSSVAEQAIDRGPRAVFSVYPERYAQNTVWITDGEVSDPLEIRDFRHVANATFALEAQIIPAELDNVRFYSWDIRQLYVLGDYDPESVASAVRRFGHDIDAGMVACFIAEKTGAPLAHDPRELPLKDLEEYNAIFHRLHNNTYMFSTKRQMGEFEVYMADSPAVAVLDLRRHAS